MESIIHNIKLHIRTARFKTVGTEWTRTRFPSPYHRIYFVTEGAAEIVLIDNTTIRLEPGWIYLLPAFSLISATCTSLMSHYFIHFQCISGLENDLFEFYEPNVAVKADGTYTQHLCELMMSRHLMNPGNHSVESELYIHGALRILLAAFFKNVKIKSPHIIKFQDVLTHIQENLSGKIKLETLAKLADLNPVYFSNLFSKTFHMPPSQFILKKRLESAQIMLVNLDKKIKEIAFETGFENEMYFSRVFRSKIGMTPGEYRRLNV